jgi:hypothetical protein
VEIGSPLENGSTCRDQNILDIFLFARDGIEKFIDRFPIFNIWGVIAIELPCQIEVLRVGDEYSILE